MDFKALREPKFAMTVAAVFLVEFAVMIPYTYLIDASLPSMHSKAYTLIPILNAAAIPGRLIPGYISDTCGHFNTMTVTTAFCAILILGMWLPASTSPRGMVAFTALFGFASGAAISLTPVVVGRVAGEGRVGGGNGVAFSVASLGVLVGVPVAGALVGGEGEGYKALIGFSGAVYFCAAIFFGIARGLVGGWRLGVVV